VIERTKTHYPSIRLSILLATLGTCVFLWGLGYKLSLYEVHEPSIHQIPVAKLMSRDEDTGASDRASIGLAASNQTPSSPLFGLMVVFCWMVPLAITEIKSEKRESRTPGFSLRSSDLSAFFFRPPPSL
jgi:hypothetical protein